MGIGHNQRMGRMPGVILGRSTVNAPRESSIKIVGEFYGESFY